MDSAVLIVGHGSPESDSWNAPMEHAATVQAQTGAPVYWAMLYREPTVQKVLRQMAEDGVTSAKVFPMFFSPGAVACTKVPQALGLPEGQTKGSVETSEGPVFLEMTGTFGDHWKMKSVLRNVLDDAHAKPKETGILAIAHGSRTGKDSAIAETNAGYMRERGFDVQVCFNDFEDPDIRKGIEGLSKRGKKDILAIPLFASPSVHTRAEIPTKIEKAEEEFGVTIRQTEEVGMRKDVAYIVIDRCFGSGNF